ncbi:MAG TPA: hypothetical protein VE172_05265 [Stackebrandtia sp.]|jgi:hypothetical protein|uniref:hypothetical protein n=1 Tax=Stackebrandtia sp. TaxID=2023065 RepID=UPI002D6E73DE|nr:hypothetical protein [Stackebrandtia sp.]HZE38203.1 hypothetical protein [Stackebrandtia sp.]
MDTMTSSRTRTQPSTVVAGKLASTMLRTGGRYAQLAAETMMLWWRSANSTPPHCDF